VVQARMAELELPMLIMHGIADKGTFIDGSKERSDKAHALLHEPEQQQVVATLVAWVTARLPAAKSRTGFDALAPFGKLSDDGPCRLRARASSSRCCASAALPLPLARATPTQTVLWISAASRANV
jgi:hypothetical protein